MADSSDAVKDQVQKVGQSLSDAFTFKKQRAALADAANKAIDKVKSILPHTDPSPTTYKYDPKALDKGSKPPSYKQGTDRVPKTGLAKLHKDEAVLNKKDAANYRAAKGSGMSRAKSVMGGGKKKSGGKKPHSMHIKRGHSGGFTVTHHHQPDEQGMTAPSEDHVVPDMDSLQQHMQEQMGDQPPAPQAAAPQIPGAGM